MLWSLKPFTKLYAISPKPMTVRMMVKLKTESSHPKALANAATAPLPKENKGDALRRTLMLCWFL